MEFQGFGFTISAGATINGIKLEIEHKGQTTDLKDHSVRLLKAGVMTGNDKASATYWDTSDEWFTYGGSTDLWGASWTRDDINNAGFGGRIACYNDNDSGIKTGYIDHVKITVYYTEAGGDNISKVQGVSLANINKINGVLKTNISKINGVSKT